MKKTISMSFAVLLLTAVSCGGKKSGLQFSETSILPVSANGKVTFSTIQSEILNSKCVTCHSEVKTEAGISSWVTPGNPDESTLFTRTEDGSMPQGGTPLSSQELELIKMYIEQLATNTSTTTTTTSGSTTSGTTSGTTTTPPSTGTTTSGTTSGTTTSGTTTSGSTTTTSVISYSKIKTDVLSPYRCTSCHSVSTEAGLAKWINKTNPESSSFYTEIKSGAMPQGGSRVPTAKQAEVLQYIKDYISTH